MSDVTEPLDNARPPRPTAQASSGEDTDRVELEVTETEPAPSPGDGEHFALELLENDDELKTLPMDAHWENESPRMCPLCFQERSYDEPNACTGWLEGVGRLGIDCGHGGTSRAYVHLANGTTLYDTDALNWLAERGRGPLARGGSS